MKDFQTVPLYLLAVHCIYCVVGHSNYREYAFMASDLYLRHPAGRYEPAGYGKLIRLST